MFQAVQPLTEGRIREAVTEVFRARPFKQASLWDRFWGWVADQLLRLLDYLLDGLRSMGASRPLSVIILVLTATVLLALLARAAWLWRFRAAAARPERAGGGGRQDGGDPWSAAQALAVAGDYTAAAHSLYAALLESAARAQQLRLHPSKTAGDYARELRSRSSRLFPRFRAFAGDYEVVIYGDQHCDRARYERLFSLAQPLLSANG